LQIEATTAETKTKNQNDKMKNQTVKQTTAAGNIVWALSKSTLATKTKVGAAKATIKANLKFSK